MHVKIFGTDRKSRNFMENVFRETQFFIFQLLKFV